MKRFIFLTFGFLGWAFFEMSGGVDFQPASARMTANADEPSRAIQKVAADEPKNVVEPAVISRAVASASIAPTPAAFVPGPSAGNAAEVQNVSVTLTSLRSLNGNVATSDNANSNANNAPIVIPSLIAPNDAETTLVEVGSEGVIRSVSGSRVNVRGGPGTDYQVVAKLGRGDSVEVIQDNGDGWVKMRSLGGGQEGWMADFLLSNG
tara:strand:- start:1709 stop:2329 length:621 start_codon:yes stop_codon:yes gene_type:complete